MSYPLPPYRFKRNSKPKPADRVPAAVALLSRSYDPPPGGTGGEMLPTPPPEPAPPQPQPFRPDPPPWHGLDVADVDLAAALTPPEPPAPPPRAVIPPPPWKAHDVDEDGWPMPPGPAVHSEPLTRPQIPAADWRQEELERLAREREHQADIEPARSLQSRPA